MKQLFLALSGVLLLASVGAGLIYYKEKSTNTLPIYILPSGYVLHAGTGFSDLVGKSISPKYFSEISESAPGNFVHIQIKEGNLIPLPVYPPNSWKLINDFWPILTALVLFLFSAFWYFFMDRDIYILFFLVSLSGFIFSLILTTTYRDHLFFLFFSLYFLVFSLINISLRLNGIELKIKWLLPESAFSIFAGIIGSSYTNRVDIFNKLFFVGLTMFVVISISHIAFLAGALFKGKNNQTLINKNICHILSFVIMPVLPGAELMLGGQIVQNHFIWVSSIQLLLFPFLFYYGIYRYSLIRIQFLFNNSLISAYLAGVFTVMYFLLYTAVTYVNPDLTTTTHCILNVLFITTAVLVMPGMKFAMGNIIDYWTYRRNQKLKNAVGKILELISSPISLRATTNQILKIINDTLDVNKVAILVPSDKFPRMDVRNLNIVRITAQSELWNYFRTNNEITVTSYLAHGSGIRESVFQFLKGLEIQIAYPLSEMDMIRKNSAIFLIGEKKNLKNFSLGELKFIKECARLASLLLKNYMLLVEDIEKKKNIRNINSATTLRKIVEVQTNPSDIKEIEVGSISTAAAKVSGDFFDLVKTNNSLFVNVGDVAGHGLGTGYLASALKSISRSMASKNSDIQQIVKALNIFLIEKYAGNEFLSLVTIAINLKNGEFQYLNAGHLPMILIRSNGELEVFPHSQKVLGVVYSNYEVFSQKLDKGDKLILYTDGITETFNQNEQVFGEERFMQFLRLNKFESPQKLADKLLIEIEKFRNGHEISDDITFMCLLLK